jgi:hypothetical protein
LNSSRICAPLSLSQEISKGWVEYYVRISSIWDYVQEAFLHASVSFILQPAALPYSMWHIWALHVYVHGKSLQFSWQHKNMKFVRRRTSALFRFTCQPALLKPQLFLTTITCQPYLLLYFHTRTCVIVQIYNQCASQEEDIDRTRLRRHAGLWDNYIYTRSSNLLKNWIIH